MILALPFNPYSVAALLKKADIPVGKIVDWDDVQDGGIMLNDKYDLQIGEYYLVLNWWNEPEHKTRSELELTPENFITEIKKVL